MIGNSDNVIPFPLERQVRKPNVPTIEDVTENVDTIKQIHIQEALEVVVPMLFNNLSLVGFEPPDEMASIKDGALIVESIRSFLSKIYDIEHPLQLIADNLFVQLDKEGTLEVSDKIKIVITAKEGEGSSPL